MNIDLLKPVLNGVFMGGISVGVDSYMYSFNKSTAAKDFGVNFAVMGSATLVNELVVNMVTLPSFLQSLKNLYGVDALTIILFVGIKYMLPSEYKGSIVKNTILSVATVLLTNYAETPLRPYAPSFLLPKV